MINLKKLALVCVASLAAFSMSCSEDNEPGDSSSSGNNPSSSGSGDEDPNLVIWVPILSYAGSSYADLDAQDTLKSAAVFPAKRNVVDIIAYPASSSPDKIYLPFEFSSFYDEGVYKGGNVLLYNINDIIPGSSQAAASILKTATKLSQISTFFNYIDLEALADGDDEVDSVDIEEDAVFLVFSTSSKWFAAVVTATANRSVTLRTISLNN